jgi:hypothetical protein
METAASSDLSQLPMHLDAKAPVHDSVRGGANALHPSQAGTATGGCGGDRTPGLSSGWPGGQLQTATFHIVRLDFAQKIFMTFYVNVRKQGINTGHLQKPRDGRPIRSAGRRAGAGRGPRLDRATPRVLATALTGKRRAATDPPPANTPPGQRSTSDLDASVVCGWALSSHVYLIENCEWYNFKTHIDLNEKFS